MTPTTPTNEESSSKLPPRQVPIPEGDRTTFYSSIPGLIVNINVGRRVIEDGGTTRMVDQKVCEFTPIGDGYGMLVTNDPEVVAKLTKRMGTTGDVFDGNEYLRRSTPAEIRLKQRDQDYSRLLETHNRLVQKLQDEGKIKSK